MTNKKRIVVIAICVASLLTLSAIGVMAQAEQPAHTFDGGVTWNELIDDERSGSVEFFSEEEPGLEQVRGTYEIILDDDGNVIDETNFQEYTLDGGITWNELIN